MQAIAFVNGETLAGPNQKMVVAVAGTATAIATKRSSNFAEAEDIAVVVFAHVAAAAPVAKKDIIPRRLTT